MTIDEKALRLRHSTVIFRVWNGEPEMLLTHGCEEGAAYIVGALELESVAEQIRQHLQRSTTSKP